MVFSVVLTKNLFLFSSIGLFDEPNNYILRKTTREHFLLSYLSILSLGNTSVLMNSSFYSKTKLSNKDINLIHSFHVDMNNAGKSDKKIIPLCRFQMEFIFLNGSTSMEFRFVF